MVHRKCGTALCGSRNYELLGHPSHFVAERKQNSFISQGTWEPEVPKAAGVIHRAVQVHPIKDCDSTGLDYVKQALPHKYLLQDHLSDVKTLKYIIILSWFMYFWYYMCINLNEFFWAVFHFCQYYNTQCRVNRFHISAPQFMRWFHLLRTF
jgi:hypothetical protein